VPLIDFLLSLKNSQINVISIPTKTSSGLHVKHEYFSDSNLKIQNLAHILFKPKLVRILSWISDNIERSNSKYVRYRLWPFIWKILLYRIYQRENNVNKFLEVIGDSTIVVDDIYLDVERTFINRLLRDRVNAQVVCIAHGQNTYLNLWHDLPRMRNIEPVSQGGLTVYSPSANHSSYLSKFNTDISLIDVGNTRFDKNWVLNKSRVSDHKTFEKFGQFQTKVLFVMSKLEYGQEVSVVEKFIHEISKIDNLALCLKPHTRGMSIESLDISLGENISIEYCVPTNALIQWADVVVFTGSSIIFEAMIKHKKILYLSCLQRYQTIFDTLPNDLICKEITNIRNNIESLSSCDYSETLNEFLITHAFAGDTDGHVCQSFYKDYLAEREKV
jgi:hypothetical protein